MALRGRRSDGRESVAAVRDDAERLAKATFESPPPPFPDHPLWAKFVRHVHTGGMCRRMTEDPWDFWRNGEMLWLTYLAAYEAGYDAGRAAE